MKVIVTGGSGGVGTYVVRELTRQHQVCIADKHPPAEAEGVEFRPVDLCDRESTSEVVRDADLLVHLAAIPHPYCDPPERVLRVNMVSTFNVLEAMRCNGIRRGIYAGSDSGTGFGIHTVTHRPLYLPIDAEHPCWPHESYSFTKYFGEVMFREYARAYAMEMISVRFMWVWLERDRESVEQIISRRSTGRFDGLCSYVMPQDVAQMIRLAADLRLDSNTGMPFEVFFAHAARTFASVETLELATRLWDPLPEVRKPSYYEDDPYAPFYDLTKEYSELGFRPRYSWEDYPAREPTT